SHVAYISVIPTGAKRSGGTSFVGVRSTGAMAKEVPPLRLASLVSGRDDGVWVTGDSPGLRGGGSKAALRPPSREDRRQTALGGLGGLSALEEEDRRHLAVLVAPPVHNRPLPVDRSDADGIGISALPVHESGTPPVPKIQHFGAAG